MVGTVAKQGKHVRVKEKSRLSRSEEAATQLQPTANLPSFQLCRIFKSSKSEFFHETTQSLKYRQLIQTFKKTLFRPPVFNSASSTQPHSYRLEYTAVPLPCIWKAA